jgi:pre-mRNA-splicing factor SYF1
MEEETVRDNTVSIEEELLRTPYNIKTWLRYVHLVRNEPARVRYTVYERALKLLPGR